MPSTGKYGRCQTRSYPHVLTPDEPFGCVSGHRGGTKCQSGQKTSASRQINSRRFFQAVLDASRPRPDVREGVRVATPTSECLGRARVGARNGIVAADLHGSAGLPLGPSGTSWSWWASRRKPRHQPRHQAEIHPGKPAKWPRSSTSLMCYRPGRPPPPPRPMQPVAHLYESPAPIGFSPNSTCGGRLHLCVPYGELILS